MPSADGYMQLPDGTLKRKDKLENPSRNPSFPSIHSPLTVKEYHRTDLGNAERLIDSHGDTLKFGFAWNKWLIWDGIRWVKDNGEGIIGKAKDIVKDIYVEASETGDSGKRKELAQFALSCESAFKIEQMIKLARSEVAIKPDELDSGKELLNCQNGTIDLETGELLPHDRKHLITKIANVEYQANATYELWLRFLNEIMDNNQNLISFIQRALGYSLTGDISERCIFILYGLGANGKTTLLSVLGGILNDYALQTPTQTLMVKHYDGIPNDIARLKGARFVTATESETSQRLNEGLIKQLAGGDMVSARFMRGEFFDFMPTHKLWLATNHKPIIRGTDKAIWDRIRLIPFNVVIPEEKQDKHLVEKLLNEASGILNWAIEGCRKWQREGLGTPEEVREATNEYRNEMDILANWLEDNCLIGKEYSATAKVLYQDYQNWCNANGEKAISQRHFGLSLTERGFERLKDRNGMNYLGVGICE